MEQNLPGGNFGQILGGIDALKAAFKRRGMDSSILDQSSASSGNPSPVAPALPETANVGGTENQIATQAITKSSQLPKIPFRSGEAELALKALADTAKIEGKIAEQSLGLR